MNYQLRSYDDDVVMETTETDAVKIGELKDNLPHEVRARLVGHRVVVAILPR